MIFGAKSEACLWGKLEVNGDVVTIGGAKIWDARFPYIGLQVIEELYTDDFVPVMQRVGPIVRIGGELHIRVNNEPFGDYPMMTPYHDEDVHWCIRPHLDADQNAVINIVGDGMVEIVGGRDVVYMRLAGEIKGFTAAKQVLRHCAILEDHHVVMSVHMVHPEDGAQVLLGRQAGIYYVMESEDHSSDTRTPFVGGLRLQDGLVPRPLNAMKMAHHTIYPMLVTVRDNS